MWPIGQCWYQDVIILAPFGQFNSNCSGIRCLWEVGRFMVAINENQLVESQRLVWCLFVGMRLVMVIVCESDNLPG